jgi:hypothetical protein
MRTKAASLATAYHEAGHVIAAVFQDISLRVHAVSIVPDRESSGRMYHSNPLQGMRLDVEVSDKARLRAERLADICLAGIEAQCRHRRSSVRSYHAHDDYRQAVDLISYFVGTPDVLDAYLHFLRARTKELLNAPGRWECVEAIAKALMAENTLSKTRVSEIIRRTLSSDFVAN